MRLKSKVVSVLLGLVLLLSTVTAYGTTSGSNEGFQDVGQDHWAYEYVELMSDLGIINGFGDGTFRPDERVTREQFSKMMVLTLGLDLVTPSIAFFQDVEKSSWSFSYIETARRYLTGFRTGSGDFFRPTSDAVREDMAVAIVLGMGLSIENVDLSVLDSFSDQGAISSNLRPYVAKAVAEGIMVGSGGSFNPQGTLKRAEAATLLARLITEEKVVYDNEKVTYDNVGISNIDTNAKTTKLSGNVDEEIHLTWTEVASEGFKYYKVVVSKNDSTPIYPENGYAQVISDVSTTSTSLEGYDKVNGGDIAKLIPGEKYYISITSVYEDGKFASNVLQLTVPMNEEESSDSSSNRKSTLVAQIKENGVFLDWTKTESSKFAYYKVVFSKYDSSPQYPGDGYLTYITDLSDTDYLASVGDSYNGGDVDGKLRSGETYYVSITVVYDDGDKYYSSNTLKITMP